jgi:OPA family sugar phosphate sensor protein UhpC-like MFS transporter
MLGRKSLVQPSTSRNAGKILLVSSIHYEAYYLCRFNLAPVLPLLIAELGLTHSEAGVLGSMLFISYALILLPAGVLGDMVGPRVVITFGAVVSAVTNLLFSYSTSFSSMMILQFVNGLGQGMAWGPLSRLMTNWYPRERMSFVMSLLSIPPALGPPLAYILSGYLASTYGWKLVFQIPFIVLMATSLVFALFVRDKPSDSALSHRWSRTSFFESLKKREVWLVSVAYLALWGATRGLTVWLPTFLVERIGMTLMAASTLGGLISLPGIPAMFVGTWLSDVKLRGRKNMIIFFSLLTPIPIMLLLPFVQGEILLLVLLAVAFALFYSAGGLYFAYPSVLVARDQVGAASGLIDTFGYVGNFLGILAIGFAVDAFKSYNPMFVISAVIAVVGALAILKVKP